MTKIQHLQFLVLMIPTILILVAAAVCMAGLALPSNQAPQMAALQVDPAYEALQVQP